MSLKKFFSHDINYFTPNDVCMRRKEIQLQASIT